MAKLSPARLGLLEHVPSALSYQGYQLYTKKPARWVALQLGSSHLKGAPHGDYKAEAHRILHLLLARFWQGEENDLGYDVLTALHHDVWQQVGDAGGMDGGQDSEDSTQLRAIRERHNLHVRIWRNKFNNRVAKPLLATLERCGVPTQATSIARTAQPGAVGWQPHFILDAITPGRAATYWSFVLDHWTADVQVIAAGSGLAYPTHLNTVISGEVSEAVEFSTATLVALLQRYQ